MEVKDPILRGILQRLVARLDSIDVAGTAIPDRSVTSSMIALGAIVTTLIADSAITLAKIADGIFTATTEARAKFANGFVNTALIADDAVDKAKVAADVAGDGLTQAGDGALQVNPDGSTLETNADALRVKDGGITAAKTADALGALIQGTPGFTVGAEAANVILVTVQLKDAKATNLAAPHVVQAWLSNAAGGAVTGAAPSGAVTATTGTIIREWTSKTHMAVASNASGAIVLSIEEAGAATWYLNVEYQGKLFSSGAITFS